MKRNLLVAFPRPLPPNQRVQISYAEWFIVKDGTKRWYRSGLLHRSEGPAVEYADGAKEWWSNGKRHRADGPAIEWPDGTREWWLNGERHRDNGPAIEWPPNWRIWYKDGVVVRSDISGPRITKPSIFDAGPRDTANQVKAAAPTRPPKP